MNPITELLSEQREEFEKKFTAFGNVYADKEAFTYWHTTAQQQLIDAIIGIMNPVELAERIVIEYANISGRESENREYVRQSARTVFEKIVNNLEQGI